MADYVTDGVTTTLFIRIDGHPQKPLQTVEDITRPWVNGVALRKRGIRGAFYTLRGLTHAGSAGAADSAAGTLAGYCGKIVSVSKGGVVYVNLAMTDVRIIERTKVVNAIGGIVSNGVWMLEVDMDFVYGGT